MMRMKPMVLAGVAATVLLATGGCTKKVGGQVVAIVNGQEITQQELNAELNGAVIPAGANRNAIMAQLLQRVIDRKLLVAKASKEGLDQSPAYLAQVERAKDGILINLMAGNAMKSVPLPDSQAASKFMADNPSLFAGRKRYQLEQIAFPATNDPTLIGKLKVAKSMEDVKSALTAAGVQFQSGNGVLDTGSIPPAAADRIAALPPGMPFLVPQNGQIVASVIRSSEAVAMPGDRAQAAAIQLLRRQNVDKALHQQLEAERASAKIQYEAGFSPPKPGTAPAAAAPMGG